MDDFALGYLVHRFFYRIFDFFYHWYYSGSRAIAYKFMATIADIDKSIAIKVTLQHFFEPLYKDYSIIGHILGIVFRAGRVLIGLLVYIAVTIIFLIFFLSWIIIPPMIIFYLIKGRLI
jgi:hypothetical protein